MSAKFPRGGGEQDLFQPEVYSLCRSDELIAMRICNIFLRNCALFDKSMKLCTEVDL